MIIKLLGTSMVTMTVSFLLLGIFDDLWVDWFRYLLCGILTISFTAAVLLVYLWIWS